MTQNIITYYIPQNLNIIKGKIYNLYINKVKNLDLSEIILNNNSTNILLTEEDYNELISIANISTKLHNQSQNIVKKLAKERNKK